MTVTLRTLDEELVDGLLRLAVDTTDPDEVMPPVEGPPGWTEERVTSFRAFYCGRLDGLDGAERTVVYVIVAADEIAGMIRLSRHDEPMEFEIGMWLGRPFRGRGLGGAAVREIVATARQLGARTILANTLPTNAGAVGALKAAGAALVLDDGKVFARITLS